MEKLFLFFVLILIQKSAAIINNPLLLINSSYPILLSTINDSYNYVITSGKSLKISKENGVIVESLDSMKYDQNFIYIYDLSNNNYIYFSNKTYFYINYTDFISFEEITVIARPIIDNLVMTNIGSIALQNEFIMYGFNSSYLFFASKNEEFRAYKSVQHIF